MSEVIGQMPVDAFLDIPFPFLRKILTHKEQFLPRMGELVGIKRLQTAKPVHNAAGSLFHHGMFAVNDFVMGKDQHIAF